MLVLCYSWVFLRVSQSDALFLQELFQELFVRDDADLERAGRTRCYGGAFLELLECNSELIAAWARIVEGLVLFLVL